MATHHNMTNITLASLLTLKDSSQPKKSYDLVVGICWSMNDFVIGVINLAQKHEYIVNLFVVHPFSLLSQAVRGPFCEVCACAMQEFANYSAVGGILLGDNVDYHPRSWICNGSDSNIFPYFLVIIHWCCTILDNQEVGWASGFKATQNCNQGMKIVAIVKSLQ